MAGGDAAGPVGADACGKPFQPVDCSSCSSLPLGPRAPMAAAVFFVSRLSDS